LKSHLSLFHRFEGGVPLQFCEVQVAGERLWRTSGAALTWGEQSETAFAGSEAALAAWHAACGELQAEGWTLVRENMLDTRQFDYALLQTQLQTAVRQALQAMRSAHPQAINAFALITDEDAMTISAMANSAEALAQTVADYGSDGDAVSDDEIMWSPAEWSYGEGAHDGGAFFDSAYRLLLQAHRGPPFEADFETHRAAVFETCIAALEQLDREGCFGSGAEREQFVLLFEVSDNEEVEGAMARLNSVTVQERWQAWVAACE